MHYDHTAIRFLDRMAGHREASFWGLQLLGWSTYFVAQFVAALFYPESIGPDKLRGYIIVLVIAASSGMALSSLLRYVFRRVRDRGMSVLLSASLAAVYAAALIWRLFINTAIATFLDESASSHGLGQFFAGALISTYLLLAWSGLYYGIYFYESVHRERLATVRAEGLAREAQLKMLRYQLNPHFLFNTLNAISTLVLDRDNDTANLAVTRLSNFLRHSLDQDPMKKVTLRQELDVLGLYLGIEQLRFGPRLRITQTISDVAKEALVPSLLLQPLVENSLKYAIATREMGGHIRIDADVQSNHLRIDISDDGPGFPAGSIPSDGRGVGLRNTRDRLGVLYGGQACLDGRNLDDGCVIEITLPAETST
jgi:two-component system, LytTR family, sensor kinase